MNLFSAYADEFVVKGYALGEESLWFAFSKYIKTHRKLDVLDF